MGVQLTHAPATDSPTRGGALWPKRCVESRRLTLNLGRGRDCVVARGLDLRSRNAASRGAAHPTGGTLTGKEKGYLMSRYSAGSAISGYVVDAADSRDRKMAFLNWTGIAARYESWASGFSVGCRIDRVTLAVDPACRISTLLHEAGHLAITPRCFRSWMDGNLYAGQRAMLDAVCDTTHHPDDPLYRAVIQCSNPEATAWAWAEGAALGLPGEEIVRNDEYSAEGEAIRLALYMRAYSGVHGLANAGFCSIRDRGGVVGWPHLHFWTQDSGNVEAADPDDDGRGGFVNGQLRIERDGAAVLSQLDSLAATFADKDEVNVP